MDKTLKRGSVTMTESSIVIAFSKEPPQKEPSRRVGYDLNEKSIVGSDGTVHDLSELARLHTLYGVRRSRFYERHPHDRRLKKKFAGSRREKERVKQALHRVATLIVEKARANNEAIVLERLKGIRYAHRKGKRRTNGDSSQDCPVALPPAPVLHRIQVEVGWGTRRVCLPRVHVQDVQRMRVHQS
jgi:putative transposase